MAIKKARVLVDGEIEGVSVRANQMAEADDKIIKAYGHMLDSAPAAVKYALEQGAKLVSIGGAPLEPEEPAPPAP